MCGPFLALINPYTHIPNGPHDGDDLRPQLPQEFRTRRPVEPTKDLKQPEMTGERVVQPVQPARIERRG